MQSGISRLKHRCWTGSKTRRGRLGIEIRTIAAPTSHQAQSRRGATRGWTCIAHSTPIQMLAGRPRQIPDITAPGTLHKQQKPLGAVLDLTHITQALLYRNQQSKQASM